MIKKKLLFVNHSAQLRGGANDEFLRILKYFSQFKDKYIIYGLFPEGPNSGNYEKYCDEWKIYPPGFFPVLSQNVLQYYGLIKIYFSQKKEIKDFLKGKQFDLCILNVVVMFWISMWINKSRMKSLIFIREKLEPEYIRRVFYKFVSTFGSYFISVSDSLEADFIKLTGKKNIQTLYSSIESRQTFQNFRNEFAKEISQSKLGKILQNNRPKFINVATLEDRKNQLMILESVKILFNKLKVNTPYFFFIGGDQDYQYAEKLKNFVLKENLSEFCYFLGEKDKNFLYNLYPLMSGMIISSKSEGLPLVLVESLRFNLPLITTKVGGIPDIIENGFNGFTINNSKESLVEAITNFLNNDVLVEEIKINGYNTYMEKFNLENNLEKLNVIVKELTGEL